MSDESPFRRVSVADVSRPTVIPATLSVETLEGEVTAGTPASIRVELRWTGDEAVTLKAARRRSNSPPSTTPRTRPSRSSGPGASTVTGRDRSAGARTGTPTRDSGAAWACG